MKTTKKFIELTVFAFALILVLANSPDDSIRRFERGTQSDIPSVSLTNETPGKGLSLRALNGGATTGGFSGGPSEGCVANFKSTVSNNHQLPFLGGDSSEGMITISFWSLKNKWDGTWPLEEEEGDWPEETDGGISTHGAIVLETRELQSRELRAGRDLTINFSLVIPCGENWFHVLAIAEGEGPIDVTVEGTVFVSNGDFIMKENESSGTTPIDFGCGGEPEGVSLEERTVESMSVEWK